MDNTPTAELGLTTVGMDPHFFEVSWVGICCLCMVWVQKPAGLAAMSVRALQGVW
jgi:hypothetical protein